MVHSGLSCTISLTGECSGPSRSWPVQGTVRQGHLSLQKEVGYPHRAYPKGEGQRRHSQHWIRPLQGHCCLPSPRFSLTPPQVEITKLKLDKDRKRILARKDTTAADKGSKVYDLPPLYASLTR